MITKDSIETAYSFLHQKRRSTSGRLLPTGRKNVYIHSSLDWQKDDIEYAIASYADDMSRELYDAISGGRADFLRDPQTVSRGYYTSSRTIRKHVIEIWRILKRYCVRIYTSSCSQ